MSKPKSASLSTGRFATGVPGLDTIWSGGPSVGGAYLMLGRPGAGKTILGNQICFNHVASGGKALFVTLLTESHSRMLHHLKSFDFFEPKHVGTSLKYVSGYDVLETEQLAGLLTLLRRAIRTQKATLLVLDGLVTAGTITESDLELKKFIHELQVILEMLGCTALLLTGESRNVEQYAIRTMVDGLVELNYEPSGMSVVRTIEVVKSRGGDFLSGRHRFDISTRGLTVHPRIETVVGRTSQRKRLDNARLPFGIESLDQMLGGGLRAGSVTMLLGSAGSGKTLLGLSFLGAGVSAKEPVLHVGFSETPAELVRNAEGLKGLSQQLKSGHIEFLWQPPGAKAIPDAIAQKIIDHVKARNVRRLFIDGTAGFKDFVVEPERTAEFFGALCSELRTLGVATLLTEETRDFFGPEIELSVSALAAMPDSIILLRHVELRARLHRLISVMKMRGGQTDPALREFIIGSNGLEIVDGGFESAESVLSGIARVRNEPPVSPPDGVRGPHRRKG